MTLDVSVIREFEKIYFEDLSVAVISNISLPVMVDGPFHFYVITFHLFQLFCLSVRISPIILRW